MQLPVWGFVVVGTAYYLSIGTVTYRAVLRNDATSYRLALAVLAGNELWNALFFERRSA